MTPITVLIADDHQIVLDGLLSFLEKEKEIEVIHTAKNGQEALDKLKQKAVDVAVLDIHMPVMDGLDAARQMLQQYSKTKILFLTMISESQFIVNALKVGAHGYVTKEKSKDYLVGAIHSVYRGASYWSPEILASIADVRMWDDHTTDEVVKFTQRETDVLCLLVHFPSYTSGDIAGQLSIAGVTVDTHIRNMKAKIKAKRRRELISYALRYKLCEEVNC